MTLPVMSAIVADVGYYCGSWLEAANTAADVGYRLALLH
jgi:hypothetical protein